VKGKRGNVPNIFDSIWCKDRWFLVDFALATCSPCDLAKTVYFVGTVMAITLMIAVAKSIDASFSTEKSEDC
jgi:hypothetical protein